MFKRKGGKPGGKSGGKPGGKSGGKKSSGKGKSSAVKRASSASGANPFDVRGNSARAKFAVLGKRVKGAGRDVAQARAQAEGKRRRTLGAEFKARHKSNEFRDRRLGEQDPSMSLEDKMMARFQTERKRKLRNAQLFALHDSDREDDDDEDADGDALFLTHQGRKIADDYDALNADGPMDEFDNDDDKARELDRDIVNKMHFGGGGAEGEEGDDRKKSHKEVMHEVMMKAKLFKAERQKTKANQEDVTEQLDQGFSDIRGLLDFRPTRANGRDKDAEKGPMDEFDKLTREFAFEAKAKATERRLSPEEAAKKEHDRLEELERKRIARMKGEDEDDSDSGDDGDKKKGKKGKKKDKSKKKGGEIVMLPTDDDLMDGYEVDKRFGAAEEEAEDDDNDDANDDGEENEEEEDQEEDEDDSEADSDDDDDEAKNGDEEEEEEDDIEDDDDDDEAEETDKKSSEPVTEEEALPFVFPCPETPEELRALFDAHAKRSPSARALIVERLIKYYSPRLSVDNQKKMKRLFAILLRQFLRWAARYDSHKQDLDNLTRLLFTLAQQISSDAGVVTREFLVSVFKRLHTPKQARVRPQQSELLLFKALSQVFPASDLRHNVISPLETLLAESLTRSVISSSTSTGESRMVLEIAHSKDAAELLTTCALLLDMGREKQRFVPEVAVCLSQMLRAFLTPSSSDDVNSWLRTELDQWKKQKQATLPLLPLTPSVNDEELAAPAVLGSVLALVDAASTQYSYLASFQELFRPMYLSMHALARDAFKKAPSQLNAVIASVNERIEAAASARAPLRLQPVAPSVLPSFAPKFDENYTVRKDKTRDRDSAQRKQLQRQVKRARKGAARELRRDAEFVARAKQEEEDVRLADKRAKQKEIWRWLEEQHATFSQQVKKGGNMLKGGGSGGPAKNRRTPRM